MTSTLARLAQWYVARCDDEWEHQYGVKIDTLDNPGWAVVIDLVDTPFERIPFVAVRILRTEADWLDCVVEQGAFRGRGGAENIGEIIELFLEWAEATGAEGQGAPSPPPAAAGPL